MNYARTPSYYCTSKQQEKTWAHPASIGAHHGILETPGGRPFSRDFRGGPCAFSYSPARASVQTGKSPQLLSAPPVGPGPLPATVYWMGFMEKLAFLSVTFALALPGWQGAKHWSHFPGTCGQDQKGTGITPSEWKKPKRRELRGDVAFLPPPPAPSPEVPGLASVYPV